MDKIELIRKEIERLIERAKAERVLHPKTILAAQNYLLIEDYNKLISFLDSLPEEPVSSVWHNASEEPTDKANCLIYYKVGDKVSYQDVFPVLYHKERKEFVSESYPHPTAHKVELKSLEGGVTAVVYKNMRDKFPLTDISKWAYLEDLLYKQEEPVSEYADNKVQYASIEGGIKAHAETYSFNIESELFNQLNKEQQAMWRKEIERAVVSGGQYGVELARDKRYKENQEPVSERLEEAYDEYSNKTEYLGLTFKGAFKAGANWQKQQTIDKACEWLKEHSYDYLEFGEAGFGATFDYPKMIEDLKEAMKKED